MSSNANLHQAQRNKKDEFYTQYSDIATEISHYVNHDPDVFRDKTVLLPCDAEWSNFTKYFEDHFAELGLRRLIRSCYREGGGDFRSPEVAALLDEADIVVTNPPFSLWRAFIDWVVEAKKQFLIIGPITAITYKAVFPLIHQGEMWLGPSIRGGGTAFEVPDEYAGAGTTRGPDGRAYVKAGNIRWFTNIMHGYLPEPLILRTMAENLSLIPSLQAKGAYERYDNWDAIEVPAVRAIPKDWDGLMGVPITFLDRYSPDQFEIVGVHGHPILNGVKKFKRILIRHTQSGYDNDPALRAALAEAMTSPRMGPRRVV